MSYNIQLASLYTQTITSFQEIFWKWWTITVITYNKHILSFRRQVIFLCFCATLYITSFQILCIFKFSLYIKGLHSFIHTSEVYSINTRDIQKVTSFYFKQLMYEWGRAHAWEITSQDTSHNWSPSVCFCLYRELWCVVRMIIPPAEVFMLLSTRLTIIMWMLGKYILNYVVYGQNVMNEGIFVHFILLRMYIKMFISYFIQRNNL
jgi:hypothetical protein